MTMTISCNRLLIAGATAALVASIPPAAATTSDLGVVPVPIATPSGNPGPFDFWLEAETEPGVSVLEACGVDPTAIPADAIRATNPKNSSTSTFFSEDGISMQITSDDGFVTMDWREDPLNELDPRPQQLGFILCLGVVGGPNVGTNLYPYQGEDATSDGNLSVPVFGQTVNKVYAIWEAGACLEPEANVQNACEALFPDPAQRAQFGIQIHSTSQVGEPSLCSCDVNNPAELCVEGEPGCFEPGTELLQDFGGQSEAVGGENSCHYFKASDGSIRKIGDTC